MKAYFEARAPQYDHWWLGTGLLARRDRPGCDREREAPGACFVQSDALRLLFRGGTFERVFTSHFYRHLDEPEGNRVADAEASAEWYGRLGFAIDWRTRPQQHLPLFVAISNGQTEIFLSEHTGDAHPGGLLYVYVDDAGAVAADGNGLRIGTPVAG